MSSKNFKIENRNAATGGPRHRPKRWFSIGLLPVSGLLAVGHVARHRRPKRLAKDEPATRNGVRGDHHPPLTGTRPDIAHGVDHQLVQLAPEGRVRLQLRASVMLASLNLNFQHARTVIRQTGKVVIGGVAIRHRFILRRSYRCDRTYTRLGIPRRLIFQVRSMLCHTHGNRLITTSIAVKNRTNIITHI